jgi:serine phosphatase RsbU (regulator of sigma subunit)
MAIFQLLPLALNKTNLQRAFRLSIIVGLILNLINGNIPLYYFGNDLHYMQLTLTFFVPFCVSVYSSFLSMYNLKPGKVSYIDAILSCKDCKKTNFHTHIGDEIGICPMCKNKTNWKISKLLSLNTNNSKLIKSLALFARHNPQPLFRIDSKGTILAANPASERLLANRDLTYQTIETYIPETKTLNLSEIIEKEKEEDKVVIIQERYYNIVIKGVKALNSIHIYGNEITDIIKAENQIKKQANEIKDSIQYASLIQQAMLPNKDQVTSIFPASFVLYKPKNVVSGDFYWIKETNEYKIIAVADCTGHGVPGAFMSMRGISLLNEIVLREKNIQPSDILNILRKRWIENFYNQTESDHIYDGMDIALAVIHKSTNELYFAGAYHPLYIIRNSELLQLEGNHTSIGSFLYDKVNYTEKSIHVLPKDRLIMFTDGYKDQIGGENDKKYSSRAFKELILQTSKYSLNEQHTAIDEEFIYWKGENEQVDDVLVLGIEIL